MKNKKNKKDRKYKKTGFSALAFLLSLLLFAAELPNFPSAVYAEESSDTKAPASAESSATTEGYADVNIASEPAAETGVSENNSENNTETSETQKDEAKGAAEPDSESESASASMNEAGRSAANAEKSAVEAGTRADEAKEAAVVSRDGQKCSSRRAPYAKPSIDISAGIGNNDSLYSCYQKDEAVISGKITISEKLKSFEVKLLNADDGSELDFSSCPVSVNTNPNPLNAAVGIFDISVTVSPQNAGLHKLKAKILSADEKGGLTEVTSPVFVIEKGKNTEAKFSRTPQNPAANDGWQKVQKIDVSVILSGTGSRPVNPDHPKAAAAPGTYPTALNFLAEGKIVLQSPLTRFAQKTDSGVNKEWSCQYEFTGIDVSGKEFSALPQITGTFNNIISEYQTEIKNPRGFSISPANGQEEPIKIDNVGPEISIGFDSGNPVGMTSDMKVKITDNGSGLSAEALKQDLSENPGNFFTRLPSNMTVQLKKGAMDGEDFKTVNADDSPDGSYIKLLECVITLSSRKNTVAEGAVELQFEDRVGNKTKKASSESPKLDNLAPRLSWKWDKLGKAQAGSAEYKLNITDPANGSGVDRSKVIEGIKAMVEEYNQSLAPEKAKNKLIFDENKVTEINGRTGDYSFVLETAGLINQKLTLTIRDKAGNPASDTSYKNVYIEGEKPYADSEKISFVKLVRSDEPGPGNDYYAEVKTKPEDFVVKKGDWIRVKFDISDNDTLDLDSMRAYFNDDTRGTEIKHREHEGETEYHANIQIGDGAGQISVPENGLIKLTKLEYKDIAGNSGESVTKDSEIRYYAPISDSTDPKTVTAYSVTLLDSSGKAKDEGQPAKAGDKIKVSVCATHPMKLSMLFDQGDSSIQEDKRSAEAELVSDGSGAYKAEYTYTVLDSTHDKAKINAELKLSDLAGNRDWIKKGKGGYLYYVDILKSVSELGIRSDNNPAGAAKMGDTVTVRFSTSHPAAVKDGKIKIAGRDVDVISDAGNSKFEASLKLEDGYFSGDDRIVPFSFTLQDEAGHEASVNQTNTNKADGSDKEVRYQKTINAGNPVKNVSLISSNDGRPSLGRVGDTLTLTFTAPHAVRVEDAKISGQGAKVSSGDGRSFVITAPMPEGYVDDGAKVPFEVRLKDDSGSTDYTFTSSDFPQNLSYVAPIKVTGLTIKSSNANDGSRYAKNGDTVTVSFNTNHEISASGDCSIAGKTAALNGNGTSYSFSVTLGNGDLTDLSNVPFSFAISDRAANTAQSFTEASPNLVNRITYYAPLTIASLKLKGDQNTPYVKNGGSVTYTAEANHDAFYLSGNAGGRGLSAQGQSKSPAAVLSIPYNEASMPEGKLAYELTFSDPAGNTANKAETTDGSFVIYDRTAVSFSIQPAVTGFTNENVELTLRFFDTNLRAEALSFTLNGIEQISDSERRSASGRTSFTKTIVLSEEGSYVLRNGAADLAGNGLEQTLELAFSIDKTKPSLSSDRLSEKKALHVKKGFKLSDFIKIDEKNIKEVLVTVTDKNGVYNIGLDDRINDEGKKTVSVTVIDEAGNRSKTFTFDILVDGTPPAIELINKKDMSVYKIEGKKLLIKDGTKLAFRLADSGMRGDRILKLLVTTPDGKTIDLLEKYNPDSGKVIDFHTDKYGVYKVIYETEDEVGNKSGKQSFEFEYLDKTRDSVLALEGKGGAEAVKAAEVQGAGPGLKLPLIIVGVIILLSLLWFLLLLLKRKKDEDER